MRWQGKDEPVFPTIHVLEPYGDVIWRQGLWELMRHEMRS